MINIYEILKFSLGLIATALVYVPYFSGVVDASINNSDVQIAYEIPEPTSVLLVTLGGVLLHRRYRRHSK